MLSLALASVFSSNGVLISQRVPDRSNSTARPVVPNPQKIPQNSAIVTFSDVGRVLAHQHQNRQKGTTEAQNRNLGKNIPGPYQHLTEEERREIEELKKRDAEVRRHEQAHVAAAGQYAEGGPEYEFTKGPDDRQYAVSGKVNIDTSPVPGDPDATIQKAQVIKRAANAPSDPSGQDQKVAAEAARLESKARMEKANEKRDESQSAQKSQENPQNRSALIAEYGVKNFAMGQLINLAA